jgi:hypothetical protein
LEKEQLRAILRERLNPTIARVNATLKGKDLRRLRPVLERVGRGAKLPHWFDQLENDGTLPNFDGKTIGSIVEMLLVGVLETYTFADVRAPLLRINPARGVDLPDLDLGVKSPSENYCTSEPFFSAYERLFGSEHDALILLTDYQRVKKNPPLRLQITKWNYLHKTQLADENLCRIALTHRAWLVSKSESRAQRVFRFLAYVNQSDWLGKQLVLLVEALQDEGRIQSCIASAQIDFERKNALRLKSFRDLIPEAAIETLKSINAVKPLHIGVIDAADNWVAEYLKDVGRLPNPNEWQRLLSGPLDGRIGMSFALQWRYNFGRVFGATGTDNDDDSSTTSDGCPVSSI